VRRPAVALLQRYKSHHCPVTKRRQVVALQKTHRGLSGLLGRAVSGLDERAGSERDGSDRGDSERDGSEREGSDLGASERGDSERLGSERGDSDRDGRS